MSFSGIWVRQAEENQDDKPWDDSERQNRLVPKSGVGWGWGWGGTDGSSNMSKNSEMKNKKHAAMPNCVKQQKNTYFLRSRKIRRSETLRRTVMPGWTEP
jgi:hypothetical protein